ncbi:MAG: zf-HC2 domain-containing protein [Elusimicrobia bacterium]|nr:zf-HC2 domain-containing protein [Elusimicrobiota bacterium]
MLGMPSCREVTRLVASGEIETLRGFKRFLVRAHYLICRYCTRYAREIRLIGRAFKAAADSRDLSAQAGRLTGRILSRLN